MSPVSAPASPIQLPALYLKRVSSHTGYHLTAAQALLEQVRGNDTVAQLRLDVLKNIQDGSDAQSGGLNAPAAVCYVGNNLREQQPVGRGGALFNQLYGGSECGTGGGGGDGPAPGEEYLCPARTELHCRHPLREAQLNQLRVYASQQDLQLLPELRCVHAHFTLGLIDLGIGAGKV